MHFPLTFRFLLFFSAIFILFSINLIYQNSKPKSEYSMLRGKIIYIGNKYNDLPARNFGKYRYLIVDQYSYPFEIFVSKDDGDFKPKYENIDKLKIGDTIEIYGYESNKVEKEGINREIQFIEKDKVLFFERGDGSKFVGIGIIIISIILAILTYYFWKTGKIEY